MVNNKIFITQPLSQYFIADYSVHQVFGKNEQEILQTVEKIINTQLKGEQFYTGSYRVEANFMQEDVFQELLKREGVVQEGYMECIEVKNFEEFNMIYSATCG